jgi:hypothetical protein
LNPSEYQVSVSNSKKGDRLVFSESFDPHWITSDDSGNIPQEASKSYDNLFNSFILPKNGNYIFEVYYEPQKWVNIGVWISLGTLVFVVGSLIALRLKIFGGKK